MRKPEAVMGGKSVQNQSVNVMSVKEVFITGTSELRCIRLRHYHVVWRGCQRIDVAPVRPKLSTAQNCRAESEPGEGMVVRDHAPKEATVDVGRP